MTSLPEPPQSGESLRLRVLRAGPWTAFSALATAVSQVAVLILVARLLDSEATGLASVVVLIITLGDLLLSAGLAQAIVQRPNVSRSELSSLYWLVMALSLTVALGSLVAAPFAAEFFSLDGSSGVLKVLALSILFSGHSQVFRAVLEKSLLFSSVAKAEVLGSLVQIATLVLLIVSGAELYAVSLSYCALTACRALLYQWSARRLFAPGFRFRLFETRRFLSFGILQFVDTLVNYAGANLSTVVIGRSLGPVQMGGYSLIYNLAVNVPAKLNPILTRVAFPAAVLLQTDKVRLRSAYSRILQLSFTLSAPPLFLFAILARPTVSLVYGPTWQWVVPAVLPLALSGILRSVTNPSGFILMACDRLLLGLTLNLTRLAIAVPSTVLAANYFGLLGAAYALLANSVIALLLAMFALKRVVDLRLLDYLKASGRSLPVMSPVLGLVALASWALQNESPQIQVSLAFLAGVVSTAIGLAFFRRKVRSAMASMR